MALNSQIGIADFTDFDFPSVDFRKQFTNDTKVKKVQLAGPFIVGWDEKQGALLIVDRNQSDYPVVAKFEPESGSSIRDLRRIEGRDDHIEILMKYGSSYRFEFRDLSNESLPVVESYAIPSNYRRFNIYGSVMVVTASDKIHLIP